MNTLNAGVAMFTKPRLFIQFKLYVTVWAGQNNWYSTLIAYIGDGTRVPIILYAGVANFDLFLNPWISSWNYFL